MIKVIYQCLYVIFYIMTLFNVEASQDKKPLNTVANSEIQNITPAQYVANLLNKFQNNKVVHSLFQGIQKLQQKITTVDPAIEIILTENEQSAFCNPKKDQPFKLQIQLNPKQSKVQVLRYAVNIDGEEYILTEQTDCPIEMVLIHEFIHLYHYLKSYIEYGYALPYADLRQIQSRKQYIFLKTAYLQMQPRALSTQQKSKQ